MSDFLMVNDFDQMICIKKEEIKSVASFNIEEPKKLYTVEILYKNSEKPHIFRFNSEEKRNDFFVSIKWKLEPYQEHTWLKSYVRETKNTIHSISKKIDLINKRLNKILKDKN